MVAGIGSVLYGFSDEAHQYFVPSRSPEQGDLLMDGGGGFFGGLFFLVIRHVQKTYFNRQGR